MQQLETEWDSDSSCSTKGSYAFDEDEVNCRTAPHWSSYRHIIESRGFRLDTFRDVREFYQRYCEGRRLEELNANDHLSGYSRACRGPDDDALCRDAGLPDNLFRGTCLRDGLKVVIKSVNLYSREFDIARRLSSPPLVNHPMNHCIPILDMIAVPEDELGFIVMEEWSPQLVCDPPCCLRGFLSALRQCIEHLVFMHHHHIAHLDISLHNILTDCKCNFAYIDYELSRCFDGVANPRIRGRRGTDIPPELERGEWANPYKVDIFSLGMLLVRACKITGYDVPELFGLVREMLHDNPGDRPSASMVLKNFDRMLPLIDESRLQSDSC
ncbi:hypothetical protein JAAARDRAFT_67217 [Jaapia argillacea MUCL 33604]|uniref:Protein kinase domain-containing protein n=1 Tax=Jaapia argillacea MUCL 33604 TaxID=933084 RepID=A0A067Q1C0_9AGAM|nr:hypothetical protein JAAARDRAFT_67217 [Jaapia argillacea MUCL 33604]